VLRIQSVNETLNVLSELEGEVVVVSIVGPYRTGKSFLLNQLVPHEPGNLTFKVGDTIKPETEEVTLVIIPPCASQGRYRHHVFLDTPGLFAPNRASIFDAQLLAVLNLVSNVVLYNSVGVIDRAAVEKLSFAVETAFAMSYFEEQDKADKISRPHLVWVVQNFHLDMSLDGTKIDGNSWINKLLTQVDDSNNGTSKISQQFHTFFSSLDAVVLPFPVDKVEDMKYLSQLPASAYTKDYHKSIDYLLMKIRSVAGPKVLGSVKMTGSSLANLIWKWSETINMPIASFKANSAQDLLDHILYQEVKKASLKYTDVMRRSVVHPSSRDLILSVHRRLIDRLAGNGPGRVRELVEAAVHPVLEDHLLAARRFVENRFQRITQRFNESVAAELAKLPSFHARTAEEILSSHLNEFHVRAAEDNISNIDSERFSMAQNEIARLVHEHRTHFYLSHVIRQAQGALNNCTRRFLREEINILENLHSETINLSNVEKEEAIRECAEEAHQSVGNILNNQTNVFLPQTLELLTAEANRKVARRIRSYRTSRKAVKLFLQCLRKLRFPTETELIDKCAAEAIEICKEAEEFISCNADEEIKRMQKRVETKNEEMSSNMCGRESEMLVNVYSTKARRWWMPDFGSTWMSPNKRKAIFDREWQSEACRGPFRSTNTFKERRGSAERDFDSISINREEALQLTLIFVYVVVITGFLSCVYTRCVDSPIYERNAEEARRERQMTCTGMLAVVQISAFVLAVWIAFCCPYAVWRLELSSKEPTVALSGDGREDGVSLLHIFVCNLLLVEIFFSCDMFIQIRRMQTKLRSSRYNV